MSEENILWAIWIKRLGSRPVYITIWMGTACVDEGPPDAVDYHCNIDLILNFVSLYTHILYKYLM